MKKSYLFIYNDAVGTREQLKKWADNSENVITWRIELPNCFYLVSEASAQTLYEDVEKAIGRRGKFLFVEFSDNRQGLLVPDSWHFIRHKEHKQN